MIEENLPEYGPEWSTLKLFYKSKARFAELYRKSQSDNTLHLEDIAAFIEECMIPLEELTDCELMSREVTRREATLHTLDVVLGSISSRTKELGTCIEEATKNRGWLDKHAGREDLSPLIGKVVRDQLAYCKKAEDRLPFLYKEISTLFTRAKRLLERHVFKDYNTDNKLLMSLILEEDVEVSVFGKGKNNRLPTIFGYMFDDGAFEAYFRAAEAWLVSSHYDLSIKSLEKSLPYYEKNRTNTKFVTKYRARMSSIYNKLHPVQKKLRDPGNLKDKEVVAEIRRLAVFSGSEEEYKFLVDNTFRKKKQKEVVARITYLIQALEGYVTPS